MYITVETDSYYFVNGDLLAGLTATWSVELDKSDLSLRDPSYTFYTATIEGFGNCPADIYLLIF